MGVLTLTITVVVHPIDTARHPTVLPGWRWAVHAGGGPPSDLSRCANAGWCPDEREALAEGEMAAATAVNAARILGLPVAPGKTLRLQHDPVPAGEDRVQVLT